MIFSTLKYTFIVVLTLVLSHLILIKGVSISRYTEIGLNMAGLGNAHLSTVAIVPKQISESVEREVAEAKENFRKQVNGHADMAMKIGEENNPEIPKADQKKLDQIIQQSARK